MDYKDKKIVERIKAIMREEGVKQVEFAKRLNTDQSSVSAVLNLKRSPMALVDKIEKVLGINRTWLLTGEGVQHGAEDVELDKNIANLSTLSIEDRTKMLSDVNLLYKRHQDLLEEASEVMKQIVELNKILLLNE